MAMQDDLNLVMSNVMGIAHLVLRDHGALTPFGVVMTKNGDVLHVTSDDSMEPEDAINRLTISCQASAKSGEYRATAIAYDIRLEKPDTGEETDAVAVDFDHKEKNTSIVYCIPYTYTNGELDMSEPISENGAGKIFGDAAGSGIIMP